MYRGCTIDVTCCSVGGINTMNILDIYSIHTRFILDKGVFRPTKKQIYRVYIEYISSIYRVCGEYLYHQPDNGWHRSYILDTYSIYTRYILDAYPPREYLSKSDIDSIYSISTRFILDRCLLDKYSMHIHHASIYQRVTLIVHTHTHHASIYQVYIEYYVSITCPVGINIMNILDTYSISSIYRVYIE